MSKPSCASGTRPSVGETGMTKRNPDRPRMTHGHTVGGESPTHNAWRGMGQRCMNPKAKDYPRYGGIGIMCCSEWNLFEQFLIDMGIRPEGHTLERNDNTKGYSKDNCRWATPLEQSMNRSNNHRIEYMGELRCLSEWARLLDINEETLRARIRYGWDISRAMTTPSTAGYHMRNQ